MPLWLQHLLVLTLVAGCLGYVGWQTLRALRGRSGKVGSCCDAGCSPSQKEGDAPKRSAGGVVFLPADSLFTRHKRK